MGRRQQGMRKLTIEKLDKGFFPNLDFDEVPAGGSSDCKHVIHRRSDLRPFPGMEVINGIKAPFVSGQGVHYMDVNAGTRRLAVYGTSIYDETAGVLTDITGAVTIGNGNVVQSVDYQLGANEFSLFAQGGGAAPFKVSQNGDAAVIAGSPPNLETIGVYHAAVLGSLKEALYFTPTGDFETWNTTRDVIFYNKDIKCVLDHGPKFAVLMKDHIGSLQGFDRLDYVKEESESPNVGCVGKMAAKNVLIGENDTEVIATVSENGIYVIDQSFVTRKLLGDNYFQEFNKSQLAKSSMAYWGDENLLFIAMPFAASTEANYLIIINTRTGAFWPGPDIHGNFIKSLGTMKDTDNNEFVYYQDNNGFLYKFNFGINSYHNGTDSENIDYKWKSKTHDLEDLHSFGELNMLAEAVGDWGINVGIKFGLEKGDGTTGSISFVDSHDTLGVDFILGASTLGGSQYVFNTLVGIGGQGRFLEVIITRQGDEANDLLGSTFILGKSRLGSQAGFRIKKMEIDLHSHRRGGNDK